MTITAKTMPAACVFDITVDAEFVHISWHPGRAWRASSAAFMAGRQDARLHDMVAVSEPLEDGSRPRVPLDGFITDSARDALLWASELAQGSKGEFRRAIEVDHCVVVAALGGSK